jgi:hypothetical protein
METQVIMPERTGQICRFINPCEGDDLGSVYIIAENPSLYDDHESIDIVNLKELQRNIRNPLNAVRMSAVKADLAVISQSLEEYIQSWNSRDI